MRTYDQLFQALYPALARRQRWRAISIRCWPPRFGYSITEGGRARRVWHLGEGNADPPEASNHPGGTAHARPRGEGALTLPFNGG